MTPAGDQSPGPSLQQKTLAGSSDINVEETIEAELRVTERTFNFSPSHVAGEIGRLGPYRVLKMLGHGGMGAVYLAVDTRLNRELALKVMLPKYAENRAARERFLREARATARLSHDHIVTVYEADEHDGIPFFAMQFLKGCTLNRYLKQKGNLNIPQILGIARGTALALAAAHEAGLVHRDIKPANLWLESPNGRVKVLDFGLAKPIDSDVKLTHHGAILGTPAFMSPEQATGQALDHRTDLFSLGSVMYLLCTGQLPFDRSGPVASLLALHEASARPVQELNPYIPPSLAGLIHQLLARDPDHRPAHTDEVAQRIESIMEEIFRPAQHYPVLFPTPMSMPIPQVIFVPVEVPAAGGRHSEESLSQMVSSDSASSAKKVRRRPEQTSAWIAAALAGLLALVILAVAVATWAGKRGAVEPTEKKPKPANKR